MSNLINELKNDHQKIKSMLEEVRELGFLRPEGQSKLLQAKNLLLEHLKREDDQLYPKLNQMAMTNSKLQNNLQAFTSEMEIVSKKALDFFSKYSSTNASGGEFISDFVKLLTSLSDRMNKEETILYKVYDGAE